MANEAKLLLSILYAINLNDPSTVSKFESNVLDILSPINVLFEFNVFKLFDITLDKYVNDEYVDSFNSIILLLLLSPYSCITSFNEFNLLSNTFVKYVVFTLNISFDSVKLFNVI